MLGPFRVFSVMGKRKRYEEEEYLARKIRKLEKKMSRVRRKQRRHRTISTSSEFEQNQCSDRECYPEESSQEAPQNEGQ